MKAMTTTKKRADRKNKRADEKSANCMAVQDAELEIFPIVHNNVFYNIITSLDLELSEIRQMLDWIQQNRTVETQLADHPDMATICDIELETVKFVVDVMNYEVLVYKRILK